MVEEDNSDGDDSDYQEEEEEEEEEENDDDDDSDFEEEEYLHLGVKKCHLLTGLCYMEDDDWGDQGHHHHQVCISSLTPLITALIMTN